MLLDIGLGYLSFVSILKTFLWLKLDLTKTLCLSVRNIKKERDSNQ